MAELTEDRVKEIVREEIKEVSKMDIKEIAKELARLQNRSEQRLKSGDQQK